MGDFFFQAKGTLWNYKIISNTKVDGWFGENSNNTKTKVMPTINPSIHSWGEKDFKTFFSILLLLQTWWLVRSEQHHHQNKANGNHKYIHPFMREGPKNIINFDFAIHIYWNMLRVMQSKASNPDTYN